MKYRLKEMRREIGDEPTYHSNMLARFGVARPGKTARDKLNGVQRFGPNRRHPVSSKK